MTIIPEPSWQTLIDELTEYKGVVLLLGDTDSGKSTLARYLTEQLVLKGLTVAFVDSDVGQTCLGLPGTISAKLFSAKEDLERFYFEKMFFIGDVNPAKKTDLMAYGTKKMAYLYRERSDIIIVDTTGLIAGDAGISLKLGKINSIKPGFVIAIQRKDELEHILELAKETRILRIKTSAMVRQRTRAERTEYRMRRFSEYFKESEMSEFSLGDVEVFHNNRPQSGRFNINSPGVLIGLNHKEDTLALGILGEADGDSITFRSPMKSLKGINRVVFGDISV
jgi:polynucleotide 5'-hydroxyl-kinase GRC3/NOL9